MFLLHCFKDLVTSGLLWVVVAKISIILLVPEALFTVSRPVNYPPEHVSDFCAQKGEETHTLIGLSEYNGMI